MRNGNIEIRGFQGKGVIQHGGGIRQKNAGILSVGRIYEDGDWGVKPKDGNDQTVQNDVKQQPAESVIFSSHFRLSASIIN